MDVGSTIEGLGPTRGGLRAGAFQRERARKKEASNKRCTELVHDFSRLSLLRNDRPDNYVLVPKAIDHNINSVNLLAVVGLWLLSKASRKAATLYGGAVTPLSSRDAELLPKAHAPPGLRC